MAGDKTNRAEQQHNADQAAAEAAKKAEEAAVEEVAEKHPKYAKLADAINKSLKTEE